MPSKPRPNLISWQSVTILQRACAAPSVDLTAAESASTLFRFFRSKHVGDLKLIFSLAILLFAIHIVIAILVAISVWVDERFFLPIDKNSPTADCFKFLISYTAPAVPIYGGIVGWAYLSASARLGIVDLFACEISTLCRVGTIVDVGKRYVEQAKSFPDQHHIETVLPPASSATFVSQENYFPIFASNSKDLQALEAMVVTHITEFYTFMKATRDSLRKLAGAKPPQAGTPTLATSQSTSKPDSWRDDLA
jgi:hypothetical protein